METQVSSTCWMGNRLVSSRWCICLFVVSLIVLLCVPEEAQYITFTVPEDFRNFSVWCFNAVVYAGYARVTFLDLAVQTAIVGRNVIEPIIYQVWPDKLGVWMVMRHRPNCHNFARPGMPLRPKRRCSEATCDVLLSRKVLY